MIDSPPAVRPYAPAVSDAANPTDADLVLATAVLERLRDSTDCYGELDNVRGQCGSDSNCPHCMAVHALASMGGWRFLGSLPGRIYDGHHPLEAAHHAAWVKFMGASGRSADCTLQQIMHDEQAPTMRDWYVASSIVRWLATNVGRSVLNNAGWHEPQRVAMCQETIERLRSDLAEAKQLVTAMLPMLPHGEALAAVLSRAKKLGAP